MNRNFPTLSLILSIAFVVSACGSTGPHQVDQEEMSAAWGGQPFTDLLVIGVYEDRTYRVSAETAFSEQLKSQGIKASPSYDFMPDLSNLENNVAIAEQLATRSHDGVLVVATIDEGYDYDVGDYFATRGMVYLLGGEPGAATDTGSFIAWAGSGYYTLYVGLWDAKTGQPVWQISTDSETTGSESGDTRALADFVASTLRGKGLL
jgi:hypothetical protein